MTNPFGRHSSDEAWAKYIRKVVLNPGAKVTSTGTRVVVVSRA